MSGDGLKVVFIGPPGAGKGTQADNLKRDFCVCHLATGDMLRAAVTAGTPLGKQAKEIMARGELVPDDVIIGMIKESIKKKECKDGFILDGFPRTVVQAQKLDGMLTEMKTKLDRAFEFAIEDKLLLQRITGRRIHPASGRTYHVDFKPPKQKGKDDVTGEPLIQREDDRPDTLSKRLDTYHKNTAPVVAYYKKQGLLTTLDASRKPDDVYSVIRSAIKKQPIGKASSK